MTQQGGMRLGPQIKTRALNLLLFVLVISVWPVAAHCNSITSASELQLLLQQSEPGARDRLQANLTPPPFFFPLCM